MRRLALGLGAILLVLVVAIGALKALWSFDDRAPEGATGRRNVTAVRTATAMVVAANPHATTAGVEILKAGGSAIDAAIAIQAVLTLVEPQSSGIGGGAFLLHFDAATKSLQGFDGRETAPAGVDPNLFMENGEALGLVEAMIGGRSVGVPGVLRALELAHRQHGKLPWKALFEPAIALCEQGFDITPRFAQLAHEDPVLRSMPGARTYFYDERGRAKAAGMRLRNPALAAVLRRIAAEGADAFYRGPVAASVVTAVQQARRPSMLQAGINYALLRLGAPYALRFAPRVRNPGSLSLEDLEGYEAREREPLCSPYRQWRVCGFAPPSSGGIAVLQALGMLERFDLRALGPPSSAEVLHVLTQAERLAYADRDRYVADADFVDVPVRGLLDREYLARRAALIDPARDAGHASPGTPPGLQSARSDAQSPELAATSHFSIVDARRNVVSMTTTIEAGHGSHVMVEGFLLNNQLTDFSFDPGSGSGQVANAVAPGKRPRSSMAPLIVFDAASGDPVLVLGSPGGSRIIGYVLRATLGALDWQLDPQAAVSLPHVVNRNGRTEIEDEGWAPEELDTLKSQLRAKGHAITVDAMNSGVHAIAITQNGLVGGADPRREGLAAGW
jgi:gamma-glutamyltranspeptidase/glutathione hydrolase